MPGIPRAAVQRVHRRHSHRDFGRVGAADDDRTSPAQIADKRRVAGRNEVGEGRHAVRCRLSLNVDIHFDGHRNTEQGSRRGKTLQRAIGSGRFSQGLIRKVQDDRVQFRVERTNALYHRRHHLRTRKLLLAYTSSNLDRAGLPQWSSHIRRSTLENDDGA